MMQVDNSNNNMIANIFKPYRKLCKVDKLYQLIEGYHNLSKYRFNQDEIDFLCECMCNGKESFLGTT